MAKHVGLIIGDEDALAEALLTRLRKEPALEADLVTIGGTAERTVSRYDVIVDRVSHLVPHYRSYLRAAALAGTNVINDPFAPAEDKFFALSLAARLGLSVPSTVLLPQKAYGHGFDPARCLRNLQFPLRWDHVGHYVGFPAVLRLARPGNAPPALVHDVGALIGAFDQTGTTPTMLQAQLVGVEAHLRCVCIRGDAVVALEIGEAAGVNGSLGEAMDAALRLTGALGLACNTVEVQIAQGRVWILDAAAATWTISPESLGQEPFERIADRLAEHVIEAARTKPRTIDKYGWADAVRP